MSTVRNVSHVIYCIALALIAGCATTVRQDRAEGSIHWGQPAGGLQVGIAAVTTASPPNQPQVEGEPLGVKVYVRNDGDLPIKIVDPTGPPGSNSPPQPSLWTIYTEPDHTSQADHARPLPATVQTLIPGEMVSFFVDLSPILASHQGPHTVAAEYDNADPVIIIATQPNTTALDVWTGQARSDELQLNDGP